MYHQRRCDSLIIPLILTHQHQQPCSASAGESPRNPLPNPFKTVTNSHLPAGSPSSSSPRTHLQCQLLPSLSSIPPDTQLTPPQLHPLLLPPNLHPQPALHLLLHPPRHPLPLLLPLGRPLLLPLLRLPRRLVRAPPRFFPHLPSSSPSTSPSPSFSTHQAFNSELNPAKNNMGEFLVNAVNETAIALAGAAVGEVKRRVLGGVGAQGQDRGRAGSGRAWGLSGLGAGLGRGSGGLSVWMFMCGCEDSLIK